MTTTRRLFFCCALTPTLAAIVILAPPPISSAQIPASPTSQFGTPVRIGYPGGDDWEPAMIADNYGHLYVAFAHADPNAQTYQTRMYVQRSDDGGQTWNTPVTVAPPPPPKSEGQFDPWFALAPDGKTLSLGFLQGYPDAPVEMFTSSDIGSTWSGPLLLSSLKPPLDKVVLVSRGSLMAVGYTDYQSHVLASVSTDSGVHWTTHIIAQEPGDLTQMLVSGGGIDSQNNIYFSWDATWNVKRKPAPAEVWVTKSADLGSTWKRTNIGESGLPSTCTQCQDGEYFASQLAMRVAADDTIYLLWNSTIHVNDSTPERIYFPRSTDHGATYSPRTDISDAPNGVGHCFPTLTTGSAPGDVRLAWMDTRTGPWNVFYRTSTDGGMTLSPSIRLSTYVPGYSYLTEHGFGFPYGDYFQMTIDGNGMTHAAWGEVGNINHPGNIWVANQTH